MMHIANTTIVQPTMWNFLKIFNLHLDMKVLIHKCNISINFIDWCNYKLAMYMLKAIFTESYFK